MSRNEFLIKKFTKENKGTSSARGGRIVGEKEEERA